MRLEGLLRFTVTAPGGVELEKNIVLIFQNDFFVVVGHNDLNRALLLLWNGLRLDAGGHLAVHELLNECANIVVCKLLVLIKRKFLIFDGLLDGESWPFAILEVQITGMCAESLSVNGGEADDTLVLLRERLEFGGQLSTLLWGFCEDIGQWDASLEIYQHRRILDLLRINIPPCSRHMSQGQLRLPMAWRKSW